MKKTWFVSALFCAALGAVSAQTVWPDIEKYSGLLMGRFVNTGTDWKKARMGAANPEVAEKYASLQDSAEYFDAALEVTLYTFYYVFSHNAAYSVPSEAEAILPRNNPRLVDRQLGAMVYNELLVTRFLGNSAAAAKWEAVLQTITGRDNVTRAEIEAYYRQNISALIAATVDAKLKKLLTMASVLEIQDIKKEDALKVYAEIAMENAANSFLGVTGTTHSQVLERLHGKYNFTQAEITGAIRSVVSDVVDAEFNKVGFLLINADTNRVDAHNATLIYESGRRQYVLNYEGYHTNGEIRKIVAPTLDALLAEMRKNRTDFDETGIQSVRNQAGLLPAERLGRDSLNDIKIIIEQFYLKPTAETYGYLRDVYVLYNTGIIAINALFRNISSSYVGTLSNLNQPLAKKIVDSHNASTIPNITLTREQQQRLLPVF
jgi:hypothetical protein